MDKIRFNFITNANRLIIKQGYQRYQFAKKCGISNPNLSRILNGKQYPRVSTAVKIAKALGVEVSELFKDVEV